MKYILNYKFLVLWYVKIGFLYVYRFRGSYEYRIIILELVFL